LAVALAGVEKPFALVGGLAVSARAEPRFTRDVDLAVAVPDDQEAEAVVHGLVQRGYRVHAAVEQEKVGRLATVRLISPGQDIDDIVTDLLFASSGVEAEVVAQADTLEILPGVVTPVAGVGDLIALKVLSQSPRRPQDAADLVSLFAIAKTTDLMRARALLDLITARGFNRGKDLTLELALGLNNAGR
jgi:hypothetical protein